MSTPSPAPARSATRRDGNGRAEALDDMIDRYFDLCGQVLTAQREMVKSMVGWFSPYYSAIDEATRATRDALSGAQNQ